jgi:hypothetical protein
LKQAFNNMNARRVVVTARMAQDLTLGALLGGGSNKVYLEITLGDKTRTTSKAKLDGTTAVFDQTLDFELPPEQPDENVELRVTVKAATMKLFKDRTVASGVSGVKDTFITGSEEAKVYLADSNGKVRHACCVALALVVTLVHGAGIHILFLFRYAACWSRVRRFANGSSQKRGNP